MDEPTSRLIDVLTKTRTVVAGARFPLAVPSGPAAAATADRLLKQLDDYLLPRLRRLDAPLLVVVGGSTGAGKSTLVNSLVRAPVSAAGVIRPTTRAPVLVSHPSDGPWFVDRRVLPGLNRTNAPRTAPDSLHVISAPALVPGVAVLDAPDFDSVVDENRDHAAQLLAAADLWLFVTTAIRYADAVPWHMLHTARARGTALAVVLDRVPTGAEAELAAHLRDMLAEQDLGETELFVIPETTLDGSGLIPEAYVAPVHLFLNELARDVVARSDVARTTAVGAIQSLVADLNALADAAEAQDYASNALDQAVTAAYGRAAIDIDATLADGSLLRGEVLATWQEFVDTGELGRALRARVGRLPDRVATAITGREPPGRRLGAALTSGFARLVEAHAIEAGERVMADWAATPVGAELVTPTLGQPRPGLRDRCDGLVADWQREVFDLVAARGSEHGRSAHHEVSSTGLLVMIAVFASATFIPTRAKIAAAGGTTVAAQDLMETVFADEAMRQLARIARDDLLVRVRALLEVEAARFGDVRAAVRPDPPAPERLRQAAHAISEIGSVHLAPIRTVAAEQDGAPAREPAGGQTPVAIPARPAGRLAGMRTRLRRAWERWP